MIGAYNALACTLYFLGDFESARRYAMRGFQIWRSGNVHSHAEDYYTPAVGCLCYGAASEWHLGEIASCQANLDEAISLAKEINDTNALALALNWATVVGYLNRNPAEVDRLASNLIELSTRHNFAYFLNTEASYRGWARSASGDAWEGIPSIEQGIRDFRATGSVLGLPAHLARKAEALHLADRASEALAAVNEAEALAERFEQRDWCAELHRLRGVFLATLGADETRIEASFCEAIRTAKEQRSVSLEKRADATYAEYRKQKATASGGNGFRLPLC
jgi:adenylate cyclase